jgi:DNA polymerase V
MTINILGKVRPGLKFPFYESRVPAGFPSPADDYLERQLDLHELLVEHPEATFFVRVEGDSMVGAGMYSGDILIVDRSLKAGHGKIIVALLNGEFTVKRLLAKGKKVYLAAENPRYAPLEITEESDFQVWGVVTYVIHRAR